jgi:hypothetical protein
MAALKTIFYGIPHVQNAIKNAATCHYECTVRYKHHFYRHNGFTGSHKNVLGAVGMG